MNELQNLYKEELRLFKKSAKTFSDQYPAITENLLRDTLDPDADMLLKGLAYLTAQLRHESAAQFPRALQSISQIIAPHLMQPVPAMTLLAFTAKPNLLNPYIVQSGKSFDTVAIGQNDHGHDITCRFNTVWPVEILPILLTDISTHKNESADGQSKLSLEFMFTSERNLLENYHFDKLRLYFNLATTDASVWLTVLHSLVQTLAITDANGRIELANDAISFPALETRNKTTTKANKGLMHQLLMDYFLCPEKFLFVDIDVSRWQKRSGSKFVLAADIALPAFPLPELRSADVQLFVAPAINQFEQFAEPLPFNAFSSELQLSAKNRQLSGDMQLDICYVDSVEGITLGEKKGVFLENALQPNKIDQASLSYTFFRKPSVAESGSLPYLGIYRNSKNENIEVLRIKVQCSQGAWGSEVPVNQVIKATSNSPELVSFTNLTQASPYQPACLVSENAWQIVSDQNITLSTLQSAEQLKQFLQHHIPESLKTTAKQKTNLHRINAIERVHTKAMEKIVKGRLLRGLQFDIFVNIDHFNGVGEVFLFSSIVNQILKMKTPINSVSQMNIINARSAEVTSWPTVLTTDLE